METMACIIRCALYTAAFAVIVHSMLLEYRKYKQQLVDDERNDLRAEWMRQHVRESLAHEEEYARYCLMRDVQKIKF